LKWWRISKKQEGAVKDLQGELTWLAYFILITHYIFGITCFLGTMNFLLILFKKPVDATLLVFIESLCCYLKLWSISLVESKTKKTAKGYGETKLKRARELFVK
jgi:hypothetical protein